MSSKTILRAADEELWKPHPDAALLRKWLEEGSLSIGDRLHEKFYDTPQPSLGWRLLATGDEELIDLALAHGAKLEEKAHASELTPLLFAFACGNVDGALRLHARGAELGALTLSCHNFWLKLFHGDNSVIPYLLNKPMDEWYDIPLKIPSEEQVTRLKKLCESEDGPYPVPALRQSHQCFGPVNMLLHDVEELRKRHQIGSETGNQRLFELGSMLKMAIFSGAPVDEPDRNGRSSLNLLSKPLHELVDGACWIARNSALRAKSALLDPHSPGVKEAQILAMQEIGAQVARRAEVLSPITSLQRYPDYALRYGFSAEMQREQLANVALHCEGLRHMVRMLDILQEGGAPVVRFAEKITDSDREHAASLKKLMEGFFAPYAGQIMANPAGFAVSSVITPEGKPARPLREVAMAGRLAEWFADARWQPRMRELCEAWEKLPAKWKQRYEHEIDTVALLRQAQAGIPSSDCLASHLTSALRRKSPPS